MGLTRRLRSKNWEPSGPPGIAVGAASGSQAAELLSITDAPTPVHNLAEIMDRQMDEFENDHRHQDPKDPGTRLLLTR